MSGSSLITEVPILWKKLLRYFLLSLLFFAAIFNDSLTNIWAVRLVLMVCWLELFLQAVKYSVHYRFCQDGLIVLFLSIPIRTIPWSYINRAEYIHEWRVPRNRYQNGVAHGQIIYLTMGGCPFFFPRMEIRCLHNLMHPLKAVTIWLPETNVLHYVERFSFFYPELEMQS